uniref:MFS domain-containing protein n=1 Tax=Parastrongyloides trichosuri TaxID=131310 RepID=A0A0N4Z083_PARTI
MTALKIYVQEKQKLLTGVNLTNSNGIIKYFSFFKQNNSCTKEPQKRSHKNLSYSSNNLTSLKVYLRLYAVVLSIGVSSMFMCSLDSVADNILPSALLYLKKIFKSKVKGFGYWEHIVSARIYGVAVGCVLTILISNKCGRKWPTFWATLMCLVGAILSALIKQGQWGLYIAVLGRFINGVGSGLSQVIGSVMIAEIPAKQHRGTLLATLTVWACIGELFGMTISLDHFLGTQKLWHYSLVVPSLILIPALCFIFIAPDSPRYLFEIGKLEECEESLKFYQHPLDVPSSLEEIIEEITEARKSQKKSIYDSDEDKSGDSSILEMDRPLKTGNVYLFDYLKARFRSRVFLKPLIVATIVQTFVHLDDWMWIYYSTNVFQSVGLSSKTAMRASVFMSIPQAIISIGLLFFFENFKRKSLLIYPTIFSIILSCIAGIGLTSSTGFLSRKNMAYLMPIIATADLSAAAVASESAYTIVPELFSQTDRVLGTAFVGIIQVKNICY